MNSGKQLKIISKGEIFAKGLEWRKGETNYYAMYSSVFGGVVTDPSLMVIPLDDHMVHRGDGIFEVLKCVNGNCYNLDAHLSRLWESSEMILLLWPCDLSTMKDIVTQTVAIGGRKDCRIRIFISRGHGGFSCSPKECKASNLYVITYSPWVAPEYFYSRGVTAITSSVPGKSSFFTRVKSCNYLPNVIAWMDAERESVDFAIILDENGYLAEGATESVAIIGEDRILKYPFFNHMLKGTTLLRGIDLSKKLIETGVLQGIRQINISREEVYASSEMLIFGTGPNVLPVVNYDRKVIGSGKPGPVFQRLSELFHWDIIGNREMLTMCF